LITQYLKDGLVIEVQLSNLINITSKILQPSQT